MSYYVKIKSFKDKEYEGEWNGKYYDTKEPKGKYPYRLFRIYIDNIEVHVKSEQRDELNKLKVQLDSPYIPSEKISTPILLDDLKKETTQPTTYIKETEQDSSSRFKLLELD